MKTFKELKERLDDLGIAYKTVVFCVGLDFFYSDEIGFNDDDKVAFDTNYGQVIINHDGKEYETFIPSMKGKAFYRSEDERLYISNTASKTRKVF